MLVYAESRDSDDTVTLDISKEEDLGPILHRVEPIARINSARDKRSMILVEGLKTRPYAGFREGFWYDLPERIWDEFDLEPLAAEQSLVYRVKARAPDHEFDLLQHRAPSPSPIESGVSVSALQLQTNATRRPLKLTVFDVGHGNWNRVSPRRGGDLYYDAGADRYWNPRQVRTAIRRSGIGSRKAKDEIVLSHWDVDHYQALLDMIPRELRGIRQVVAPIPIPGTVTVRRAINKLQGNNVPVVGIPPSARPPGAGRRILLLPHSRSGRVHLFRATSGASKNQTGITLRIAGPNRDALLTGDHHYPKVFDTIGSPRRQHVLVVPHHGGNAGNIDVQAWGTIRGLDGLISCGPNQWTHPLPYVTGRLGAAGATLQDTQASGDLIELL